MLEKRRAIYKASQGYFFEHNDKIVAFKDTKQVTAFKRKYFDLYRGFRSPDSILYTRNIYEGENTVRYEDIPTVQLKERNSYWMAFFNGTGIEGKEEPYGPVHNHCTVN